jgi:hypothetical protein
MQEVRCSCGTSHDTRSLRTLGRQYSDSGEYFELANCPACGSTLCLSANVEGASAVRLRVATAATRMRRTH